MNALKIKENRLSEIPATYEEVIDNMTEEEKDTDVLNDANDAFVAKEIPKKIKELKGLKAERKTEETTAFIKKLTNVEKLIKEEKELKAQIKKESAELHLLTKKTIENLTNEQVYILLEKKWIEPITTSLNKLPDTIVTELVTKIEAIASKYQTTYFEVEEQIKETEKELCSMIDELTGNDFDMKGLSEFKKLLIGGEDE